VNDATHPGAASPYPRIRVEDFGRLPAAADVGPLAASRAIMTEIARSGPVTCNVASDAMMPYVGVGVIEEAQGNRTEWDTDHVIEMVGWGVDVADDGTAIPYWEIRNSWGEYWGDNGFGKIYRGRNDMLVESACFWVHPAGWGVPDSPKWQDNTDPHAHDHAAAELVALHHADRPSRPAMIHRVHDATLSGRVVLVCVMAGLLVLALYLAVRSSWSSKGAAAARGYGGVPSSAEEDHIEG